MGCSYMSHAVIGVRVFYDDVFENRVVKAFEHDYPAGWKLDPQTGKPLWTEERVLKPGFQWDKYEDEVEKCMGFNVVQSATNERLRRRDVYFIALAHTKDQERYDDTPVGTLAPFDLTALAKNFIPFYNAMNSIGLWRPDNFGLWSYQYISC